MKELDVKYVTELEAFIFEYGTLVGKYYPANKDELHIRSIVNTEPNNGDFKDGFEQIILEFEQSKLFKSLHVVRIHNHAFRSHLTNNWNFSYVSDEEVVRLNPNL